MEKDLVVGFFIGIILYSFIFGAKVIKVLIRARWKIEMVRRGLFMTFNRPGFVIAQIITILLCTAGSMALYYLYRKGYF
ncbi:hypothetical protein KY358_06505, partial [Candidatus Woesearchaeota archaeon]|nr:hypothetical protein [Candidatus Woesearchaeota archaeon]